ncbi:Glucanosyltransferase-domain-containing protein [Aspergillus taichungensis]|uniref:1,3-beta-glucanosyltransferase n=1 Tax=Aspergillus taichungensis TaxID=482145 RepID=A0A2J5I850_9EURO|nr:Glucanosyltransferase-domain-containing protein [Aspergillus taichungensis]
MRGIAYQQEWTGKGGDSDGKKYKDSMADPEGCKRDIPLLKELKTNTIRVYQIDPKADHKECMEMLDEAGIYVVADLSEPATSINRKDPKWNDDLYERYTAVIDELAHYTNVIGFFAGNEVTNDKGNTEASAFVKAAVRDMKQYIKKKNYRQMGVGYATNDDAEIRDNLVDYFYCGEEDETVDFWGYNIYSWCGDSSFEKSGYDDVVKQFTGFSVPVFFAEYGCNLVKPRPFTEVKALYGDKMTPAISGGILYMYFQEDNEYGLVEIEDGKAKKLKDFESLKKQMEKVDPKGTTLDEYTAKNIELRQCPSISGTWKAHEKLPPTPNRELCECMVKSLTCKAKDDIDPEDLGDLFSSVCGMNKDACVGFSTNPKKGQYGAYSMCNPTEQLSHAYNTYYELNGKKDTACDFEGTAEIQDAEKPKDTCAALIKEAGKDGSGTVGGSDSEGSDGEDSPQGSSAASPLAIPSFNFGVLSLSAYLVCAMTAGAGMLFI